MAAKQYEVEQEEDTETEKMVKLGSYGGEVRLLTVDLESESKYESAAEETMLLWGIQQPTLSKPNAFVSQSSHNLRIDACGRSLSILQCPSSLVFIFSCLWLYSSNDYNTTPVLARTFCFLFLSVMCVYNLLYDQDQEWHVSNVTCPSFM